MALQYFGSLSSTRPQSTMNRLFRFTALLCTVFAVAQATPLNESQSIRIRKRAFGQPVLIQRAGSTKSRPSLDEYTKLRNEFLGSEESRILGSRILLSAEEAKSNDIIMAAKNAEIQEGLSIPHLFTPSQYFFSVLEKIKSSELFKLLKLMPKGAVLHAHDTALCSTGYLIQLTYKPELWVCSDSKLRSIEFVFAREKPKDLDECSWKLTSEMRNELGASVYDDYLRDRLSLYRKEKFEDNNAAWKGFLTIFRLIEGLLTYATVWSEYYYQALKEFYEDGVQYLEFRTTLPVLYDLNGTTYTNIDTARIYEATLKQFKTDYPNFIGSKLIYAPLRAVGTFNVTEYIETAIELKATFPDFFAGFDLVGQEELGKPLIDFLPQLLSIPDDINFYFHAGETNWYGSRIDENVIDAVLLGSKRVGHGYALIKHPAVLARLKENDIAVEVNPVSNQVLQLVNDLRNHPCSHYFADDYPVVISSDDPSFWRATPLTHDFYVAFLGIASTRADLKLLKQLAINSIVYSAMDNDEKVVAFSKWQSEWEDFIEKLQNSGISNHLD